MVKVNNGGPIDCTYLDDKESYSGWKGGKSEFQTLHQTLEATTLMFETITYASKLILKLKSTKMS